MTPKLTDDQRQAIEAEAGEPVYVVDDKKHAVYVLLPAENFQRIRSLVGPDVFAIPETYPLQEAVAAAAGWNEPRMSDYDAPSFPASSRPRA